MFVVVVMDVGDGIVFCVVVVVVDVGNVCCGSGGGDGG